MKTIRLLVIIVLDLLCVIKFDSLGSTCGPGVVVGNHRPIFSNPFSEGIVLHLRPSPMNEITHAYLIQETSLECCVLGDNPNKCIILKWSRLQIGPLMHI